jgi:hypothetical protein
LRRLRAKKSPKLMLAATSTTPKAMPTLVPEDKPLDMGGAVVSVLRGGAFVVVVVEDDVVIDDEVVAVDDPGKDVVNCISGAVVEELPNDAANEVDVEDDEGADALILKYRDVEESEPSEGGPGLSQKKKTGETLRSKLNVSTVHGN